MNAEETEMTNRPSPSQLPSDHQSNVKHVFDFRNCRCSVNTKKGQKELLHGVSGSARSGEVLAVMGPSGAGKTTLLNLLTLVKSSAKVSGDVTLNGQTLSPSMIRSYCAVVPQVDEHWAFLTCREALGYASDLYMHNATEEAKKQRVDDLITHMGLGKCAETRCGNKFVQGLSGGEKRRLSLALALVKDPLMLLLDEPTSGLDATAAASVMRYLHKIALSQNIIVICTIHQPSPKMFESFDRTMVLSGGRVAYCGPASWLPEYLSSIGKPIPSNARPAEHLLDLVNAEFTDPAEVKVVVDCWEKREALQPAPQEQAADLPCRANASPSLSGQLWHLLRRHTTLVVRDPTLYFGRMVLFCLMGIFFSLVYLKARDRVQEQVMYRMWLSLWSFAIPSALSVASVYAFNSEFHAIRKEVRDGMFSPLSYLAATTALQIPLMFVLSLCAIGIGDYCISNFHAPAFWHMLGLVAAALWGFECIAQALSVTFGNPLLGMLCFTGTWLVSLLFSGILVPEGDIVWPLRVLSFLLPMRWSLSSIVTIEFSDTVFEGAVLADNWRGFECANRRIACYGHTGSQVLDSLGRVFPSISSTDHVVRDSGCILAIALVCKLVYCAILWYKTTAMQQPKPSHERSTAAVDVSSEVGTFSSGVFRDEMRSQSSSLRSGPQILSSVVIVPNGAP